MTALSTYYQGGSPAPNGLVLGFGAVTPAEIVRGMQQLAVVLERVQAADRDSSAPTTR